VGLSLLAVAGFAQDLAPAHAALQDAAPDVVVSALGCEDVFTRELALAQIARENRAPALTKAAAVALPKLARPDVRAQLIAVLAERGDAAALPAVRRALKDPDPQVRAAAAQACGLLKDAQAADALFAMLGGEQDEAAREALRRIPGVRVDARLKKMIRKEQGVARVQALELLCARRGRDVFEVALDRALFESGDPALARAAAAAVKAYAPSGSFGRVLDFALALPPVQAELLAGTLGALLDESADRAACERLAAQALAGAGAQHAALLTALLAGSQGAEALEVLSVRLESADLEVRKDAMRNLGKWNGDAALVPLVLAARREGEAAAQTLAWRSVLEVVRRSDKLADLSKPLSALQQTIGSAPRREERLAALQTLPLFYPKAPEVEWLLAKVEAELPELAEEARRIKRGLVPPLSGPSSR
jgi:HEAT repeat protein